MLALTEKQRRDAEAGGKRPYWRFKLSGRSREWADLVLGARRAALTAVSDPIVVRDDGTPTAILASVVDDIDYGTTHIIRGGDNTGNTAIQIELFQVLGGSERQIRFGHLPTNGDSGKPAAGLDRSRDLDTGSTPAARRIYGLTLRGLRNDGVEPIAIAACMTSAGPPTGDPVTLDKLTDRFELTGLAAAGFDVTRMLAINRKVLGELDFAAVADRLPGGATEAFWLAVRGRLDMLKEARGWWDVVAGTIVPPVIEGARDLLLTAGALLPPEPWDTAVWTKWIAALDEATGQSGESLVGPLRLALTGEDSGPDLGELLPLIGRARAASRLEFAASYTRRP
jgi:glutamyl-tRNA synthetase